MPRFELTQRGAETTESNGSGVGEVLGASRLAGTLLGEERRRFLFGGLWELFLILVRARFRLSGPYWRWRSETAFGSDPAKRPPAAERFRQVLAYGRWVHRMKKEHK